MLALFIPRPSEMRISVVVAEVIVDLVYQMTSNPGRAEYVVSFSSSMPGERAQKVIEEILYKRGWRCEWLISLLIVKEVV